MPTSLFLALRRISLRQQQLVVFGGVTFVMLILTVLTLDYTARYSRVFGSNLNRYFHIHELRTGLSDVHENLERYFRTGDASALAEAERTAPSVWRSYQHLAEFGFLDRDSLHELRATYFGLRRYDTVVRLAVAEYRSDVETYYLEFEYAGRVRAYVDLYLERFFQIQLELGRAGYSRALDQQARIRWSAIIGIGLVALGLVLFALFFSRSVATPLERLARAAHALSEGHFDLPAIELPDGPELREVAVAFNTMSSNIRRLVLDLKDKQEIERRLHQQELSNVSMERLLRESQLVALQSQMNPHFLFNTLNSIARTATIEKADRSRNLIQGLSVVLRYILRNPRRSVALSEEIRIVQEYLALQAVRFGDRLSITVEIDPRAEDAQIPPLILQPLVENAVIYGIEPLEPGGRVTVIADCENLRDGNGRLRIHVGDNGAGMSPETVSHLLQDQPDTGGQSTEGIGVLNVRARLELFFGDDHEFVIRSAPGKGTDVFLTIPLARTTETYGLHAAHS